MDARLREVAQAGDTNELYNCICNNADVLEHVDKEFVENPLHIAATRGHTDFAIALMYLKPSLARKLNQAILSPMHLALQSGHYETVLRLLAVNSDLVRVKGKDGYTPLHHVVRQGNLDLLVQFLKDCPACVEDVTIKSETALHIAVQYDNFEAFKILTRWIQRTDIYGKVSRKHVLDLKDRDGNTVLHLAAVNTQPQMIKLLLECDVDTKETNKSGWTALSVLKSQSRSDNREKSLKILRCSGRNLTIEAFFFSLFLGKTRGQGTLPERYSSKITCKERAISSLVNLSAGRINALLVVLALILTASYQAMLTPPGVLIGDISGNDTIAAKDKSYFHTFVVVNFAVFIYTSLIAVALLQLATRNKSVIVFVIIELLLSALTACMGISFQFMAPIHPPKYQSSTWSVGLLDYKIWPWLVAIFMVLGLEVSRWVARKILLVGLFIQSKLHGEGGKLSLILRI